MAMGPDVRLNDWVEMFEEIYFLSQNRERSRYQVYGRLVEACGGLWKAFARQEDLQETERWIAKVFAWYCALLKELRVVDLEQLVWSKYPWLCPFCRGNPCECEPGEVDREIDIAALQSRARERQRWCPSSLREWQGMFDDIYAQGDQAVFACDGEGDEDGPGRILAFSFARLVEETTEVSEAIRVEPFSPEVLRNELADLLAWQCGVVNLVGPAFGVDRVDFGQLVWSHYPDECDSCGEKVCRCRPDEVQRLLSESGVHAPTGRDALTDVRTRESLEAELRRYQFGGKPRYGGAIFIDVDDLKYYNDETPGGHRQGDAVIKATAAKIQESVPAEATVFRYGGDEFVVLVPDESTVSDCAESLDYGLSEVEVPDVTGREMQYPLSASIGFASVADAEREGKGIVELADEAMYEVKRGGKGGVARFRRRDEE